MEKQTEPHTIAFWKDGDYNIRIKQHGDRSFFTITAHSWRRGELVDFTTRTSIKACKQYINERIHCRY